MLILSSEGLSGCLQRSAVVAKKGNKICHIGGKYFMAKSNT